MEDRSSGDRVIKHLRRYQRRLLSPKSNRCILLEKTDNRYDFDLSRLEESRINDIIGKSFWYNQTALILSDGDDSEHAAKIRDDLRKIYRSMSQSENETGSQHCHLGFPFLKGSIDKKIHVRAPIALFPASIFHDAAGKDGGGWYLTFTSYTPILNHTLLAALESLGGCTIEGTLESDLQKFVSSAEFKESNYDVNKFIKYVTRLIVKRGIPLGTVDVPNTRKTPALDIDADADDAPLRVDTHKMIGSFPQDGIILYREYDGMITKFCDDHTNKMITEILDRDDISGDGTSSTADDSADDTTYDSADDTADSITNYSGYDPDDISDEELNLALPTDPSQERVVLASQKEAVTVVNRLPRTGRTQTIVNVIVNALARRQKILVICHKKALLKAVYQQMDAIGLARYVVPLSRNRGDRLTWYGQMRQTLEQTQEVDYDPADEIAMLSKKIDRIMSPHAKIRRALTRRYFGGVTAGDLYALSSSEYSTVLDLTGVAGSISYPSLDDFICGISRIEADYKRFMDHSWRARRSFARLDSTDAEKIAETLTDVTTRSTDCIILSNQSDQDDLARLVSKYDGVVLATNLIREEMAASYSIIQDISARCGGAVPLAQFDELTECADAKPTDRLGELVKCISAGLILWDKYHDRKTISAILENSILAKTQKEQEELLRSVTPSRESFFKRMSDPDAKERDKIRTEYLKRPENKRRDASEVHARLADGMELWRLVKSPLEARHIFEGAILAETKEDQDDLLRSAKNLAHHKETLCQNQKKIGSMIRSIRSLLGSSDVGHDADPHVLKAMMHNRDAILKDFDALSQFVDSAGMAEIRGMAHDPTRLGRHIQKMQDGMADFDALRRHDIRMCGLSSAQQHVLDQCALRLNRDADWPDIIKKELYAHWIKLVEEENPILRTDHLSRYKEAAEQLHLLLDEKRRLVVQKISRDIEASAGFKPGKVGQRTEKETRRYNLHRELGRGNRAKPIKRLFAEYDNVLLRIAPCWLATPAMISDTFPLTRGMFDIVVADEAGQMATEMALPALYRGLRAVILGDKKQLKPHDILHTGRVSSDTASLLSLAGKNRSSIPLQWQHKPAKCEIADFAAHTFYDGMLYAPPGIRRGTSDSVIIPVDYPVDSNADDGKDADAIKMVDSLERILTGCGDRPPKVRIVAFDHMQHSMILDEIERRAQTMPEFDDLCKVLKPYNLLVKTVEAVQGDEVDACIFSLRHLLKADRIEPHSLGNDDYKSRLNVAITCAASKIVVVCPSGADGVLEPEIFADFIRYAKALGRGEVSLPACSMVPQQIIMSELVRNRLEQIGYAVDSQVGGSGYRIDLAVVDPRDPDRYILGIEFDASLTSPASGVQEMYISRQKTLEECGWQMIRVWSRDWWQNSDAVIGLIRRRIEDICDIK